jgi:FaeA-like protein
LPKLQAPSAALSGTPKKQHDKGARGGLLLQIGSFGVIILKDFGSVLSMHAETRAETLAALREVYDGAWTRHLGSAGGKSLTWKGKVAVLFGATEVIDAHHSVIGAMGDRFLLSRLKPVPGKKQFTRALKHAGTGMGDMRKELSAAVNQLFAKRRPQAAEINAEEAEEIGKAIALAVRLRGAVARDYRSREIEAIYQAEGTARIGLALERLLAGLDTLGMNRKQALAIVTEVALDSVPPLRRRAYDCVGKYSDVETTDIAIALGLPTGSARRILEDLEGHGLITRTSQGTGKPDLWNKSTWEADEAAADAKED